MSGDTEIRVTRADFFDRRHAEAIVSLMDLYARDPMGGGRPLPPERLARLPDALASRPQAFSVLAFHEDRAAGLVNCFESFSTFACQPLVNVHDVVVHPGLRGRGIAAAMLGLVEQIARDRGCCKLTMEVLEGNHAARRAYRRCGFAPYRLRPDDGVAMFWEKQLPPQGRATQGSQGLV